jgi:integrase/recombinase XerD
MRPAPDPTRRSLKVDEWNDIDRDLWRAAAGRTDFEDELTLVAAWRGTTRTINERGYGRWLTHCHLSGCPSNLSPAKRVTPDRVNGYLLTMSGQGIKPSTQRNRIGQLAAVISVLAPHHDWKWLKKIQMRLDGQVKARPKRQPLTLLAGDILPKAEGALNRLEVSGRTDLNTAAEHRNWLMVSMLTLVPLRLHNFAGLSIGHSFRHFQGTWQVDLPAEDVKTKTPLSIQVPAMLTRHIDYYLAQTRPVLLQGAESDRLWISRLARPMSDGSLYAQIVQFTQRALGSKINPHRFRHIAASSLVLSSPDMIEAARALLAHARTATTEQHYILGQSVAVSRQHAELVNRLRRRLGKRATPEAED